MTNMSVNHFTHHLNSSYRMITSLDVIDALTALILGFVMNMFISSSRDSVLANIFTLWFSVIVDVLGLDYKIQTPTSCLLLIVKALTPQSTFSSEVCHLRY
jgi:hypothetical protein